VGLGGEIEQRLGQPNLLGAIYNKLAVNIGVALLPFVLALDLLLPLAHFAEGAPKLFDRIHLGLWLSPPPPPSAEQGPAHASILRWGRFLG
jgi:hypothetical protein